MNTRAANLPAVDLPFPGQDNTRSVWLCLSIAPGLDYHGEFYPVRPGREMAEIIEAHEGLKSGGFVPALTKRHKDDGLQWGDVRQVAEWTDPLDGKTKLMGLVKFTADAWEDVLAARLRWLSPEYGEKRSGHPGSPVYPRALRHLTTTSNPVQTQIQSIQHWAARCGHSITVELSDTMNEDKKPQPEQPAEETDEKEVSLADVVSMMDGITERLDAMDGRMANLEKGEGTAASDKATTEPPEKPVEQVAASDVPDFDAILTRHLAPLTSKVEALEAKQAAEDKEEARAELVQLSDEEFDFAYEVAGGDVNKVRKIAALKVKGAGPSPYKGKRTPKTRPPVRASDAAPTTDELFDRATEIITKDGGDHDVVYRGLLKEHGLAG